MIYTLVLLFLQLLL